MTMPSDGDEPMDLLRTLAQLSSDAIIVADTGSAAESCVADFAVATVPSSSECVVSIVLPPQAIAKTADPAASTGPSRERTVRITHPLAPRVTSELPGGECASSRRKPTVSA